MGEGDRTVGEGERTEGVMDEVEALALAGRNTLTNGLPCAAGC